MPPLIDLTSPDSSQHTGASCACCYTTLRRLWPILITTSRMSSTCHGVKISATLDSSHSPTPCVPTSSPSGSVPPFPTTEWRSCPGSRGARRLSRRSRWPVAGRAGLAVPGRPVAHGRAEPRRRDGRGPPRYGRGAEISAKRAAWAQANFPGHFSFSELAAAGIRSSEARTRAPFQHFAPDFSYRYRKVSEATVGQMVSAGVAASRRCPGRNVDLVRLRLAPSEGPSPTEPGATPAPRPNRCVARCEEGGHECDAAGLGSLGRRLLLTRRSHRELQWAGPVGTAPSVVAPGEHQRQGG